jgi:uncharacterized protein
MNFNYFLKFFVPINDEFYPMFEGQSKCILKASELLLELVNIKKTPEEKNEIFIKIKEIEHEGDSFTQEIYNHLNQSFITPFDREDIHELASKLDDVLDNIHAISKRIQWYKPKFKKISDEWKNFTGIIHESAKEIEISIMLLRNTSKNIGKIRLSCSNINVLERKADEIFYKYMSDLFEEETDCIEVVKKKDIIMALENTVNSAEDVSDIIKTILIKIV